jgi:hypothetical protein
MTMKQAINVDYKFINNVLINIFITIQRGRYDIIKSCFTKNTCNYNACSDINKQGYVCAKKKCACTGMVLFKNAYLPSITACSKL